MDGYGRMRSTQPYRKTNARPVGETLYAMIKGRTGTGINPQDAKRKAMRMLNRNGVRRVRNTRG